MFVYFLRNTNNLSKWDTFFIKCQKEFPLEYNLLADKNLNREQVLEAMKSSGSTQKQYKDLIKISNTKKRLIQKEYVSELEKLIDDKTISSFLKSPQWPIAKECRGYLDCIQRLAYSIAVKNVDMINNVLSEIVKIDPLFLTVEISQNVAVDERKRLREAIFSLMNKLKDFNGDLKLRDMYFKRIEIIDDSNLKIIVNDTLDNLFKSPVEFNLFDYMYVVKRPLAWFWRLPVIERKELSVAYYNSPAITDMEIKDISILGEIIPNNNILRERILTKFYKNIENYRGHELYSIIDTLDNPLLKKSVAEIYPYFEKPVFVIKKDLYRKEFKKRPNFFSLMKLIELGDQNDELLWWLL